MQLSWYHYHLTRPSPPSGGMFVHDFVPVELPFDAVVGAFTYFVSPQLIAMLVAEAWTSELAEVGRHLDSAQPSGATPSVMAHLGTVRIRKGAVVVPLSWRTEREPWVPSLEADLEIARFGVDRTHLHVMGLSDLAPGTLPCTERASLDHRLTVALVRNVLVSLAQMLGHELVEDES